MSALAAFKSTDVRNSGEGSSRPGCEAKEPSVKFDRLGDVEDVQKRE
jgi:hypothetical protein